MPEAPTGQTRSRGQFAESAVMAQVPGLKNEIDKLADQLGPLSGRWNEFMTGKLGGDPGDPDYGKYQALRTDMLLLSSGAAKMHLNSVKAIEEFNKLADTGKMTPDILNNFVSTVEKWANTYANQGRGRPAGMPAPPAASGKTPAPQIVPSAPKTADDLAKQLGIHH